jgi:FkbM family methyltransferase
MAQKFKGILFIIFKSLIKPLSGLGIGKIKIIKVILNYLVFFFRDSAITVDGFKMYICQNFKPEIIDEYGMEFLLYGKWEPYTSKLFINEVTKARTVVDVGANIGYYTLLGSSSLGDKGEVYSFEPDERNFDLLLKNIKLNHFNNILPVRRAVSNVTGKSLLFLNKYSGWHSLFNAHGDSVSSVVVDTVTLDDYFINNDIVIDVVKIDVEGAEIPVLQGMRQQIEKNESIKIFIEFSPDCINKSGFSTEDFWEQLMLLGFSHIYLIDEIDQNIYEVDHTNAMDYYSKKFKSIGSYNLLCSKLPR